MITHQHAFIASVQVVGKDRGRQIGHEKEDPVDLLHRDGSLDGLEGTRMSEKDSKSRDGPRDTSNRHC